jgi:hypothetical protein
MIIRQLDAEAFTQTCNAIFLTAGRARRDFSPGRDDFTIDHAVYLIKNRAGTASLPTVAGVMQGGNGSVLPGVRQSLCS